MCFYRRFINKSQSTSMQAALKRMSNGARGRYGDGYAGWPEHAPFDAVIVTAAPPRVPDPLKQQLKVRGRLVILDACQGE